MTTLKYQPVIIYKKKFGELAILKDQKIMICRLTKPYVSIEKFMKIFNKATKFIEEYNVEKFIFDKRQLQAFHQPSMEWYFVVWKKELFERFGLTEHRKILPQNQEWFADAVAAGRAKIERDFPNNIIEHLNIVYCNSLDEAIEK